MARERRQYGVRRDVGIPVGISRFPGRRKDIGSAQVVESEEAFAASKMFARFTVAVLPQPTQRSVLLQLIRAQSSQSTAWFNGIRSKWLV